MLILQTFIVYTLLAFLMCYCAFRSQGSTKTAKLWGWTPILLFTLVFGLRYGVGIDYNNYLGIYEYTKDYTLSELWEYERFEEGFSLIVYLCHYFGAPVYFFFSVLAFLQILFLHKTFKDEKDVLPYIYITLIFTGICMSSYMNIIRQIIAACLFLYSIRYIRDNKLIKYWLCCLLALTLHHSALILFPLYFIWIKKKGVFNNPLIEFGILFLSLCSVFLTGWQGILYKFDSLTILLGYEGYIGQADKMLSSGGRGLGMFDILQFIIYAIIVLNSKQIKDYFKSDLFNIIYDIFLIGTCLGYLFSGSMMLGRIIIYFTNTQYILLAYLLCYLYNVKRESTNQYIKYAFCVLFIVLQYGRFIYYCEQNTGAYVSYFQTELHDLKDNQRDQMLNNRNK